MNSNKIGMETLLEGFAKNICVKPELIKSENLNKALTLYAQKIENLKQEFSFDFDR